MQARHLLAIALAASLAVGPAVPRLVQAAEKKGAAASKSTITVSSLTRGAKVYLNDDEVGEVPLPGPLDVKPGVTYTVRVQKRGYAPFTDTIMAGAGQNSEVEADLVPTGGVVRINANVMRAQVLLNGKPLGRTPFDGDVSPGKHELIVVAPGYLSDKRTIEVKAGDELAVEVELKVVPAPIETENKSIFGKWWFWGAIGGAVIGGITAGVLSQQVELVKPGDPNRTLKL